MSSRSSNYLKTLPSIDADRIGYMGMSHGGEMAFKIASEYHGVRAMIASEPASHEFLRLRPDDTARINPETGLLDVERMLMREAEKVRPRITEDVAKERMSTIKTPIFVHGRNSDELQGIFRVCYDLLVELGKDAKWATYEHDEHGFVYVQRNDQGVYDPDPVQVQAVNDSIAFFDRHMKRWQSSCPGLTRASSKKNSGKKMDCRVKPGNDAGIEAVEETKMTRPFEGIRVIDVTHVLAGPFAAYQLAVLGADVIKVDHPDDPDQSR